MTLLSAAVLAGVLLATASATPRAVPSARSSQVKVTPPTPSRPPAPHAGSFLSLVPACGCARTTRLQQFSTRTGRLETTLDRVGAPDTSDTSAVHVGPHGSITFTVSAGPGCRGSGPSSECTPKPSSCRSTTVSIQSSGHGPESDQLVLTSRGDPSTLTTDAVPSPAGRLEAFVTEPCTAYLDSHLLIADGRSRHTWTIGADAPACHIIGTPQFNPAGTELVFPWGPSRVHGRQSPSGLGGDSCPAPEASRLALVPSGHRSTSRSFTMIAPDPGCSFAAAAFDRTGIAAVEGCVHRGPKGERDFNLGDGYLLQLSGSRHQVARRIALHRGVEQATVAQDPDTGNVLVTQDQPANNGGPERDYVWTFDGRALHLVGSYRADDAAQVLAAPW